MSTEPDQLIDDASIEDPWERAESARDAGQIIFQNHDAEQLVRLGRLYVSLGQRARDDGGDGS